MLVVERFRGSECGCWWSRDRSKERQQALRVFGSVSYELRSPEDAMNIGDRVEVKQVAGSLSFWHGRFCVLRLEGETVVVGFADARVGYGIEAKYDKQDVRGVVK